MRQIALDTESTGLDPEQGHRVIEIGAIELLDRRFSGRRFHRYLQPDRAIDSGALEVHGITEADLKDQPRFGDVASEFLRFVDGAELLIHNADFDIAFLDNELNLLSDSLGQRRMRDTCSVVDTLALARRMHPGQRNSLDALCKRYRVDNSRRNLHSALLDAELLAEAYLAMTGGQATLDLSASAVSVLSRHGPTVVPRRSPPRVVGATAAELEAHGRRLDALDAASGGACTWRRLESGAVDASDPGDVVPRGDVEEALPRVSTGSAAGSTAVSPGSDSRISQESSAIDSAARTDFEGMGGPR